MWRKRAQQVPRTRRKALERPLVVSSPCSFELSSKPSMATCAQALSILSMGKAARLINKSHKALSHARRAQLIAEHWGKRKRQRRLARVKQIKQWQIAGRNRLPQPLLTKRPCAKALDIRHMRVQHNRQGAALICRTCQWTSSLLTAGTPR